MRAGIKRIRAAAAAVRTFKSMVNRGFPAFLLSYLVYSAKKLARDCQVAFFTRRCSGTSESDINEAVVREGADLDTLIGETGLLGALGRDGLELVTADGLDLLRQEVHLYKIK